MKKIFLILFLSGFLSFVFAFFLANTAFAAELNVTLKNAPSGAARWQLVICDWGITTPLGNWGIGLTPSDPDNINQTAAFEIPDGDYYPLRIMDLSINRWNNAHDALIGLYTMQSVHPYLWDWDIGGYGNEPDPTYREVFIPGPGNYYYNVATEGFEEIVSPQTCSQLGGQCCSSGQTCTSGRISGASDCVECCGSINNCQAATQTCVQSGGQCCSSGQTCTSGRISGASDCVECCSSVSNCQAHEEPVEGCPTGGLVPCGTPGCPCQFCHFFVLINNILRDVLFKFVPIIAVAMLIIGGILFFFAGASPSALAQAKRIITSVVVGLVIIFCAWIIVNTVLTKIGVVQSPALLQWWQINCPIQ